MKVTVVGSGCAGSILARVLAVQGHDVTLVEKEAHPRFAIGESSTPLAAICLERLAKRYTLPDLCDLAAYGRWIETMPEVRRGLKRGFTFYGHERGRYFANTEQNSRRLLVAASPNDHVADSHWLRSDVDAHLVQAAADAGVRYMDRTEITAVAADDTIALQGTGPAGPVFIEADFLVDATGGADFLGRQLAIPEGVRSTDLSTALVYGHFEHVKSFADLAGESIPMPTGPYPDDRAAVHHLLREGWMYQLPFDHGVVSAGFVIERGPWWSDYRDMTPDQLWNEMLGTYPSLAKQFAEANAVREIRIIPALQRTLARAAGRNWALLPHAFSFSSPMFSTGLAWSLLGVERLARALEAKTATAELERYDGLLRDEAAHIERLTAGAYAGRGDFDLFVEYAMLYFVAASYAEASQRLLDRSPDGHEWCWNGFLGACDPILGPLVTRTSEYLRGKRKPDAVELTAMTKEAIAARNIAGLADPSRNRLYPVDLDDLIKSADLLGLTTEEIRVQLPRLRGQSSDLAVRR